MTDAEFLTIKGLAREVPARCDKETTQFIPSPKPLSLDETHIYTPAT